MRYYILCLLCFLSSLTVWAETPDEHIFVFERSTNTNYVCYDINLQNGKLNKKEPLHPYWRLDHGTHFVEEDLTFLDRKMAFGVKIVSASEDEAVVYLTAYKDLKIHLCKQNGKWVGLVKLHGHEMVLQKMFAQMKPPFSIKCEYVDIFGTDTTSGEKRQERIIP